MEGYIKLHRSLLKWEWFSDDNVFRVFMYCLLNATYQDIKFRGKKIKRGSFVTTVKNICLNTNLSTQNVRTALIKLEITGEIKRKVTNKNTQITVVNWDKYQVYDDLLTNNQQTTNKQLTNSIYNKKDKKVKKYESKETNKRNKIFYIEDTLPTYDSNNNPEIDNERLEELLKKRRGIA